MAYVNVADWKPEQVAEWLRGIDIVVLPYIHSFLAKNIKGQQLLDMQPNDLEQLGVLKLGHQEIILEAIELLRHFHYELDRENLQLLALRLSCLAHSLHRELWNNHVNNSIVSTQVLADVANVVTAVKPLVCWLDRSPFSGQLSYIDKKNELLKLSLEMATSGQRERFAEKPVENIRRSCKMLAELADSIIQEEDDSLILQPASLDLATLKKRPGDSLGLYINPSFHGIHQVGEQKCNSPAHLCAKLENGDEIVQINYQTVVGWKVKELLSLFEESDTTDILVTLKKRPRHSKVFGQIYIKPYRLPCKKQMGYSTRWCELITPTRSNILTLPNFSIPFGPRTLSPVKVPADPVEVENTELPPPPSPTPSAVSCNSNISMESDGPHSPGSCRMYHPKPRIPAQRRMTISGASPIYKLAPLSLEQFWHELKLAKESRNSTEKSYEKSNSETLLESFSNIDSWHSGVKNPAESSSLPTSCQRIPEAVENCIQQGKENIDSNIPDGIIPLKDRIASFNRAVDQISKSEKPKLLPKPILENKINSSVKPQIPARSTPLTPIKIPMQFAPKDPTNSSRRERGKLDKSYSTPSYDYSADSKECLTVFTPKLQSKPINMDFPTRAKGIQNTKFSDEDSLKNEYLEIKADDILVIKANESEDIANQYLEIKSSDPYSVTTNGNDLEEIKNEYLEIKTDDPFIMDENEFPNAKAEYLQLSNNNFSAMTKENDTQHSRCSKLSNQNIDRRNLNSSNNGKKDSYNKVDNAILDTINSSLLYNTDSQVEQTARKQLHTANILESSSSKKDNKEFKDSSTSGLVLPAVKERSLRTPVETDSAPKFDRSNINKNNISYPIERLLGHTNIDPPLILMRNKVEPEASASTIPPPEPPPRPLKAHSVQKHSYNDRGTIPKTLIKAALHKSPRSLRKKNPLLAKRRNVSIKDLGVCDHEGWLYHRSRRVGRGSPQWIKGWFIIKGTIFYGFNSRESPRARLMISLPGFTVSPAEEVKSRNFAFKVYHTGTTFYFAAECGEDLGGWVESFQRVTVSEEEQNIVMSETDGEDEDENKKMEKNNENTSHTPTIKKISTLLSSHLMHDSSKSEKKFNSLKKTRKSGKDDNHTAETNTHVTSASLDRKYLKFLGGGAKQAIVPVPTAQFRSYRRVPPANATDSMPSTPEHSRSNSATSDVSVATASPTRPPDMADYRLASLTKSNNSNNNSSDNNNSINSHDQRSQESQATPGYMTLETFMMSRQEEERRHQLQHQHLRSAMLRVPQCHAPPPPNVSHLILNATASIAATGHEEHSAPFNISHTSSPSISSTRDQSQEHKGALVEKSNFSLRQKFSSDSHSKRLKKTAQYQPPPWEITTGASEESRLHPAFEMTLDHSAIDNFNANSNNANAVSTNKIHNKRQDVSSTPSTNTNSGTRFKNLFSSNKHDVHKSLLSSPRLRRVLFKDKRNQNARSINSDNSVRESATQDVVPRNLDDSESAANASSMVSTDTPEYPGLEYPPVFEPGTYSLSDVSTILRTRSMHGNCQNNIMYSSPNDCVPPVRKQSSNDNNNNDDDNYDRSIDNIVTASDGIISINSINEFHHYENNRDDHRTS